MQRNVVVRVVSIAAVAAAPAGLLQKRLEYTQEYCQEMHFPRAHSRHWNFYLALGGGAAVLLVTWVPLMALSAVVAAIVFSLLYLGLTARDLPKLKPAYLREHASDEDAPPLIVFMLTLAIILYVTVSLLPVVEQRPPCSCRWEWRRWFSAG